MSTKIPDLMATKYMKAGFALLAGAIRFAEGISNANKAELVLISDKKQMNPIGFEKTAQEMCKGDTTND